MGRLRATVKVTGNDNVVGINSGNLDFQDRFSELPDSLLVEILSWLPMKDAVKTGILCKRWKTLWTLVDRIRFCYDDFRGFKGVERFISYVDNTLLQCTCPNLTGFSLRMLDECCFKPGFAAAIEKWLRYVSSKNVKFLNLEVNVCSFQLSGWSSWFSLEKLSLGHISVDDKEIADILLSCPLLDTLILKTLSQINYLNIASPKLRKLEVLSFNGNDYIVDDNAFLEINAPWLQELEISGDFYAFKYWLVDMSSLVFAKVTFPYNPDYDNYNDEESFSLDMTTNILKKLHHVEKLIVGPLLVQALSVLKVLGRPPPLFRCKQLTVESCLLDRELPGTACLLQSSPYLETLIIKVLNLPEYYFDVYFMERSNFSEKYLDMQKGNFMHLKNIKVVHGRNLCMHKQPRHGDIECFDFQLVAYLLKNACVPEKIVITSQINNYCKCSINCSWQHLSSLSHKLIYNCLDGNGATQCEFRKNQSCFEFIFLARALDK